MKTIKVKEATCLQLNWLVELCEGMKDTPHSRRNVARSLSGPANDWARGGEIKSREKIGTWFDEKRQCWIAATNDFVNAEGETDFMETYIYQDKFGTVTGSTELEAAMRCHVISRMGEVVEVPEEFVASPVATLHYIPVAEYTIGLCHYGHKEPYKTIEVKADSMQQAMEEGRKLLKPSTVEHICNVATRPNPDHVAAMTKS